MARPPNKSRASLKKSVDGFSGETITFVSQYQVAYLMPEHDRKFFAPFTILYFWAGPM